MYVSETGCWKKESPARFGSLGMTRVLGNVAPVDPPMGISSTTSIETRSMPQLLKV